MVKTCRVCKKQVPDETLAPCPHCGESKGFSTHVTIIEPPILVNDFVRWEGEITRTIETKTKHQKKSILELIIMIVSITIEGSFELVLEVYTPFLMLATFFITAIPFWCNDIITRTMERVHMSSED